MSKRTAENQLTKDTANYSDSNSESEVQNQRDTATEEVIATRRIVSVKRGALAKKAPEQTPVSPIKETNDTESPKESISVGLFSGLTSIATESTEPKSLFSGLSTLAETTEKPSGGLFSSLFSGESSFTTNAFSFTAAPAGTTSFPSFGETPEDEESSEQEEKEEPAPTSAIIDNGEDEDLIYQNDCKLFKLMKQEEGPLKWTEKGIGFVRLIKQKESGQIRLVVRMKGVYRLMLNTGFVPKIARCEKVGNKSVKFTAIEDDVISDFRLNLFMEDQQTAFLASLDQDLMAA